MPRRGDSQQWKGWRTSTDPAPIKGDLPTKKPGTRRKKKGKLNPWFWVRNKRKSACPGCDRELAVGEVVAFSRPKKVLCAGCIAAKGIKATASHKLKEERRAKVEQQLRKARGE